MRILFVHQNFPGQFKHLASALAADPKNEVLAIGDIKEAGQRPHFPGVRLVCYETPQGPSSSTHNYIRGFETGVRRGQQVFRLALKLRETGFTPDLIYCHPAWGEGLYLKDVFPDSKLLHFFEFFYRANGADVNFDPEFPSTLDDNLRVRTKNTIQLLSLADADQGLSPTHWQWSQYPPEFREKISVIFDGIDTEQICPNPQVMLELKGFGKVTTADEVITFVSRGLEPYRGIHTFIRALPEILRRRPNALIIIVGSDEVSYGRALEEGTYRHRYLAEIEEQADLSRVYFVGRLPRDQLTKVLQLSSVHVYLTYPFVLSWSMLEAMSAGSLVIGSRTPPVQEVIEDGRNGLLVDFFNPMEVAETVDRVFNHPDRMRTLREEARQTIRQRYDLKTICLPKQLELIHALLNKS
jgi:glycosyltransferase involved in cell wall biosynthesis